LDYGGIMGGMVAGAVLTEGTAVTAAGAGGGAAGAGMSGEVMSFFGKDAASANKLTEFASQNKISPQQVSNMLHRVFGENPGGPQSPEHHKNPVQTFVNLFKHMNQLSELSKSLAEKKSKPKDPTQMSMTPQPTAPDDKKEEEKAEEAATARRRSSMSLKPRGG
jgi:hypothetical protein